MLLWRIATNVLHRKSYFQGKLSIKSHFSLDKETKYFGSDQYRSIYITSKNLTQNLSVAVQVGNDPLMNKLEYMNTHKPFKSKLPNVLGPSKP